MTLAVLVALLPVIPAAAVVIDRIVATVNGEAITLYDLYRAELPIFGKLILPGEGDIKSPEDRARERDLLGRLIDERLLLQRAKERGVAATPAEVDEALQRIRDGNRMSEEMLAQGLAKRGMSLAEYRDRLAKQITVSLLFNSEMRAKALVTPGEVAEYYRKHESEYVTPEKIRIRHILILKKAEEGGEDGGLATAREVLSRLVAGADFQETARQFSQDTAERKGEISGYLSKGDPLPELETVIFNLEPGQLSSIIETAMGYHIIKVEEKKKGSVRTLAEATAEITEKLSAEKMSGLYREWLEGIRKQATIDIQL